MQNCQVYLTVPWRMFDGSLRSIITILVMRLKSALQPIQDSSGQKGRTTSGISWLFLWKMFIFNSLSNVLHVNILFARYSLIVVRMWYARGENGFLCMSNTSLSNSAIQGFFKRVPLLKFDQIILIRFLFKSFPSWPKHQLIYFNELQIKCDQWFFTCSAIGDPFLCIFGYLPTCNQ